MLGLRGVSGAIVICVPSSTPAVFLDDLAGVCVFCGQGVRFRPHAPAPRTLICISCFALRVEPGDTVEPTAKTLDELDAVFSDPSKLPKC